MSVAYAARVIELTATGPVVQVPMLGGGQEWGPLASSVVDLAVNDQVVVQPLGESADSLHVLARLQGRRTAQGEVPGLVERLDDIEAKNAAQDSRLGGIDTLNTAQNTRLTNLETRATTLESRATGVENRATALESRATSIEGVNTTQNNRLSATETVANAAATATALAALDAAALHKTGAETKAGVLTLSAEPVIPAATLATSPVRSDDTRLIAYHCRVRYIGADVTLTGGQNTFAGDKWAAVVDPRGMVTDGTATVIPSINIPVAGLWRFNFRPIFSQTTNTTDHATAFITRNVRAAGNAIGRDVRKFTNSADGSPLQAICEWVCGAGDTIYWANYVSVNAVLKGGAINGLYTDITATYMGPV